MDKNKPQSILCQSCFGKGCKECDNCGHILVEMRSVKIGPDESKRLLTENNQRKRKLLELSNYSEIPRTCSKCKYHIERENHYVERMWDDFCTFHKEEIEVKPSASCKHYSPKDL